MFRVVLDRDAGRVEVEDDGTGRRVLRGPCKSETTKDLVRFEGGRSFRTTNDQGVDP